MPKDENVGFPEKWKKKLPGGFADEADALDSDALKKKIIEAENNIVLLEREKENDHKLNGAKDLVKEMSAPYKEGQQFQTAKIKYCLHLLESRGEDLEST